MSIWSSKNNIETKIIEKKSTPSNTRSKDEKKSDYCRPKQPGRRKDQFKDTPSGRTSKRFDRSHGYCVQPSVKWSHHNNGQVRGQRIPGDYVKTNQGAGGVLRKVNPNDLLNFRFESRGSSRNTSYSSSGRNRKFSEHSAYTREQIVQANSKFLVDNDGDYTGLYVDPDAFVPWESIEQVKIIVEGLASCPICLSPPSAAKITKCGHIHCWPCILRYLSYDCKNTRSCPICHIDIAKTELKSVLIREVQPLVGGEEVTMQLMHCHYNSTNPKPLLDRMSDAGVNSHENKIVMASPLTVLYGVVEKESIQLRDLKVDQSLEPCEIAFIDAALDECKLREDELLLKCVHSKQVSTEDENVEVDDEEIAMPLAERKDSTSSTSTVSKTQLVAGNKRNAYYFYQSVDGRPIYLHGLNVKCLLEEYGSFECCPKTITGKVIEVVGMTITEATRKRHKYLSHLPVSCCIGVVELNLQPPVVSQETLKEFKIQLDGRRKMREQKKSEEKKQQQRAKANDRKQLFQRNEYFASEQSDYSAASVGVLLPASDVNFAQSHSAAEHAPAADSGGSMSFAQILKHRSQNPIPQNPYSAVAHTKSVADLSSQDRNSDSGNLSDDPNYICPPTYQMSFGDALCSALDAVEMSAGMENKAGQLRKKKRSKKKAMVLFSSSQQQHFKKPN